MAIKQKQDGDKLARQMRRYKVLRWKIAGATVRTISQMFEAEGTPVSIATVSKDVKLVLKEMADAHSEEATSMRALMQSRYDEMFGRYFPKALNGDIGAAELILKVMKGIREINGLDPEVGSPERPLTGRTFVELFGQLQVEDSAPQPMPPTLAGDTIIDVPVRELPPGSTNGAQEGNGD